MNSRLSRQLLIAEALLFALPLTTLLAVGIAEISTSLGRDEAWPWMAIDLITILASLAAFAGWWLIVRRGPVPKDRWQNMKQACETHAHERGAYCQHSWNGITV